MSGTGYKLEQPPSRKRIPKVVVHPRYGDEVVATGCKASTAEILASCRHASALEIYPESAIRADLRKQNAEWTNPRQFYVDQLRQCAKCRRRFIFFAREQQFWSEELRINVAATARFCWECAEKNREVQAALTRYEGTGSPDELDNGALLQLAGDLVALRTAEILRTDAKLRRVKNLLTRRRIAADKWKGLRKFLGE